MTLARIRSIKPEILPDAKAGRLSHEAWRLWVSSWTLADDTGRLPADPTMLAGQVFWGCPADVPRALKELEKSGLVRVYKVRGDTYMEIRGFARHQKIDRPSGPKYPGPEDAREPSTSPREDSRALDEPSMLTAITTAINDRDHEGELEGGLAAGPPASQAKRPSPGRRVKPSNPTAEETESIRAVIEKLNERSGRSYSPDTPEHWRRVLRLLRSGYTELEIRMVIWDRGNRWSDDPKMQPYLRPATLFGSEKFADYLAEAKQAYEKSGEKPAGHLRVVDGGGG